MSAANQYKNVENRVTDFLVKYVKIAGNAIGSFLKNIIIVGKQRFTVMFIPHSEKKIFNFRISVFSLIFLCILLTGVLVAFFFASTQFSGLSRLLSTKSSSLETTQASLEIIRDEITELRKVSRKFEDTLYTTLDTLGLENSTGGSAASATGDLSSFIDIEEQEEGVMRELSDIQSISTFLDESVSSLERITELLVSHGDLLVELPTLWPVKGGRGRVTNRFGPAEHPFTKKWYLHKGTDIAFQRGYPILATANGKVVENKFEPLGFGNYIVIRHKYGFFTKYAHLDRVYVKEGDMVTQGQKIGTLGSTGLSTGPHVHYEVRIGSQVVDPERYLSISSGLKRLTSKE